jgi:glycosyltransferase involved in cell wall biosynthesis
MVPRDRKVELSVALVALYPAPGAKAPGGVRAVVQNLVGGLRVYDDLRIHVIHCHGDIHERGVVEDGNVRVEYIPIPRPRLVPNSLMAIERVERRLREIRPDVVNTHAAHYTLAALQAGYPTVFTIHGVVEREAEIYSSSWFDRARFWLERRLERRALNGVHDIVAISPYVLEQYRGRTSARFHRIDNPLSADFFSLPDLAEERRLLCPATIDERKNTLDLLRALVIVRRQAQDVRLRIAGRSTNPGYQRRVEQFVTSEGLQPNVEFLGLLDREALLEEYARCTAVVLASRQETAPMAVIEAMAAGKPVIATRVGGVPELVENGRSALLVEPGDVAGLADSMLRLLNEAETRRRMGQRARELAQRFRVEPIAAAYRELYYAVDGRTPA